MKLNAAIVTVEGRDFLFYIEPSGDEFDLHCITNCSLGQIATKTTFTIRGDETEDDAWQFFSKDNFAVQRERLMESVYMIDEAASETMTDHSGDTK